MIDFCNSDLFYFFFFFNDPATTEIYTLSLHDALPICVLLGLHFHREERCVVDADADLLHRRDRKSTRLNSSHSSISYAVFCLKKKKTAVLTMEDSSHYAVKHHDQHLVVYPSLAPDLHR